MDSVPKPAHGELPWYAKGDVLFDRVNELVDEHNANPLTNGDTNLTGAAVGKVVAVTGTNPTTFGLKTVLAPPPSGGDDRAVLQALMVTGNRVQLQPGTYLLASKGTSYHSGKHALDIPAGCSIIGAGRGVTIVKAAGSLVRDTPMFLTHTPTDIEIAHFTIDGNKQRLAAPDVGTYEDEGLNFKGSPARLSIHHMHIHDTGQDCIDFDQAQGAQDVDISYCRLNAAGGFGIHNGAERMLVHKVTITGCGFERAAAGVSPIGGMDMVWNDATLSNSHIYGNAAYQLVIEGGGNITNNENETPVYVDTYRQKIINCVIDASGVAGTEAIHMLRTPKMVQILDSTIIGSTTATAIVGVSGSGACQDCVIERCDVSTAATATNYEAINLPGPRNKVRHNRISGGNRGLTFADADCVAEGNRFTGQAVRAMVSSTATGMRIRRNVFDTSPSTESLTLNSGGGHLVENNDFGVAISGLTGNTLRGNTGPGRVNTDDGLLQIGQETIPRLSANSNTLSTTSGSLRLTYFTARKSETSTQVRVWSGATAAGATPTLCRIALYTIDSSGVGTLVASTTSDTTLFAATGTAYTRSWSSSYAMVAGQRYALGVLVVTGAAAPQLIGFGQQANTEGAQSPRLNAVLTGQTDLPLSFTDGSLSSSGSVVYGAILP